MALDTFANFKTAIADQLARDDLTSQIPDFITLFESEAGDKLKIRPNEVSTTLATTSGVVTLPTDYFGWRSVKWNGSPTNELEYVHPTTMNTLYPSSPSGTPFLFTIQGDSIKVMPVDDTGITFDYFARNSAISSALNTLFTVNVNCYWAGTLYEAYSYIKDYDQANYWKQRRDEIFDDISLLNFKEQGNMQIFNAGLSP